MIWQVIAGIVAGLWTGYMIGSAIGQTRGYQIAARDFCLGWNSVTMEKRPRV
jgi:hypothetical protein